jgi:hypothetical protein
MTGGVRTNCQIRRCFSPTFKKCQNGFNMIKSARKSSNVLQKLIESDTELSKSERILREIAGEFVYVSKL